MPHFGWLPSFVKDAIWRNYVGISSKRGWHIDCQIVCATSAFFATLRLEARGRYDHSGEENAGLLSVGRPRRRRGLRRGTREGDAGAMWQEDYNPGERGRIIFYYVLALCVVGALMLSFSSFRSKPLEETITVDSNRTKPISMTPTAMPEELPAVDRDIETAGDRVAAAVIYLKHKQSQSALNALEQAAAATQRALERKPDKSSIRDELLATNQKIESVKDLIKSGRIGTATTALKEVDQKLEAVSY